MGDCRVIVESYDDKIINDNVHGYVRLQRGHVKVLDTPQFQRMRYIKQLAAVSYVFPGATHDRLSHMIGTCHIAKVVLDHLMSLQPDLEIEKHEVQAVALAALCHDIGHGPFSHVLDNEIIPAISGPQDRWNHEERGAEVLDFLIDDNGLEIDSDAVAMAKELFLGNIPEKRTLRYQRRFLWDIVANQRTSVDVDKFDYLARDSKYCGVPTSFDHNRIIQMMRVVDGEICFSATEAEAVYELFTMRAKMHRTVYQHKCVKAIEYMIVDCLKAANPVYHFENALTRGNIKAFCKLDDSLLRHILVSENNELKTAQAIIKRIEQRDLYKWVNEFPMPAKSCHTFTPVKPEDIVKFAPTEGNHAKLHNDDIIVHNLRIDFGKGPNNPVNDVGFFDKHNPDQKFPIPSQKLSVMLPQAYTDSTVRIFSRTRDRGKIDAIRAASEAYQEKVLGAIVQRTPQKRLRADEEQKPAFDDPTESLRTVRNLNSEF